VLIGRKIDETNLNNSAIIRHRLNKFSIRVRVFAFFAFASFSASAKDNLIVNMECERNAMGLVCARRVWGFSGRKDEQTKQKRERKVKEDEEKTFLQLSYHHRQIYTSCSQLND
jgi:hypothetical protein